MVVTGDLRTTERASVRGSTKPIGGDVDPSRASQGVPKFGAARGRRHESRSSIAIT